VYTFFNQQIRLDSKCVYVYFGRVCVVSDCYDMVIWFAKAILFSFPKEMTLHIQFNSIYNDEHSTKQNKNSLAIKRAKHTRLTMEFYFFRYSLCLDWCT